MICSTRGSGDHRIESDLQSTIGGALFRDHKIEMKTETPLLPYEFAATLELEGYA
jgi:hypothetical protein